METDVLPARYRLNSDEVRFLPIRLVVGVSDLKSYFGRSSLEDHSIENGDGHGRKFAKYLTLMVTAFLILYFVVV